MGLVIVEFNNSVASFVYYYYIGFSVFQKMSSCISNVIIKIYASGFEILQYSLILYKS